MTVLRAWCVALGAALGLLVLGAPVGAQEPPALTQPVNDFARIIDPQSANAISALIRSLQDASGDVVVVATVPTTEPYGTPRDYAVKMFENHGRGIGEKGKDNGLLILLAVKERRVEVEVGYDLEEFVTDGFAGETSREVMAPEFRRGAYGAGLLAGVSTIASRIAERRNVTLQGVPAQRRRSIDSEGGSGKSILVALFVLFLILNGLGGRMGGGRRRRWHSGVGPFGGGFGGGLGGGGFGGGGFGGVPYSSASADRSCPAMVREFFSMLVVRGKSGRRFTRVPFIK